mmetsp:Transcript_28775/g.72431  ORF Transcript_28775/g.72431 Transcript_28775/m.72431 type:complete len:197 (+) Transcript_28775:36-626(+)
MGKDKGCCGCDTGGLCCCCGWSARCWLAFLAVCQFCVCLGTYFTPLVWVLGPLALIALLVVFAAIYLQWKRGLQIFLLVTVVLTILDLVPLLSIDTSSQADFGGIPIPENPHRAFIFGLSFCVNWFCLSFCSYLLFCSKHNGLRDEEPDEHPQGQTGSHGDQAEPGEKTNLMGQAKGTSKYVGEKVSHLRPPKSWV